MHDDDRDGGGWEFAAYAALAAALFAFAVLSRATH